MLRLMMHFKFRMVLLICCLATLETAHAVPSFARQTGMECVACHVSWPELTTVGRQFKLGGYTLIKPIAGEERPLVSFKRDSDPPLIPIAGFLQTSVTRTANTNSPGTDPSNFPDQKSLELQQASVFLAGRLAEHVGSFIQYSYDGLADKGQIDNVDLRYANSYKSDKLNVAYGFSLNNNPTVSDIYNTTPVWGFPFASSSVAPSPAASTLIQEGLGQQVAGLTAYSLWNRTLYAEIGAYVTADGIFNILREGVPREEAAVLQDTAPYWRFALQHEWQEGTQSAMLGTFGMNANKYPDPMDPNGATDQFNDVGIDAQYQYVTDQHRISLQWSSIRETQNLKGSFAKLASDSESSHLSVDTAKLTYYYQTRYGVSVGYQRISGDTNMAMYGGPVPVSGSANGSPDSEAYILELNWLPWRDRRFTLQYTAYEKFNGAKDNYDGYGRNASDNNSLYLLAWFMF